VLAQARDRPALSQGHLDDLVNILGLNPTVEEVLRLDYHGRRQAALTVAPHINDSNLLPESRRRDLLPKGLAELDRAAGAASGHADQHSCPKLTLRCPRLLAEAFEIGWSI
jgi:hypothetical protein